jgi:hypothetical protein
MGELRDILLNILGPILLMVLLGAILRWRFKLDLDSLSKLNIWLFVPAFVFDKVTGSSLRWQEMAGVVGATALHTIILGMLVWTVGAIARVQHKLLAAVILAVMFYNSGNFGLPLAELAYPAAQAKHTGKDGAAVQAFVLMTQNVMNFTIGLLIAAWAGSGNFAKGLLTLLRLPILPSLAAALLTRWLTGEDHARVPRLIAETSRYLGAGLVPVALVTLGAQLASNPRWPRWRPISLVLLLRLVYAPMQMAALLWILGRLSSAKGSAWGMLSLRPWPAEMLVLTAAVPTAVNTLLLTLELDGDADLAADCVFWTTICSAATITFWLLVLRR